MSIARTLERWGIFSATQPVSIPVNANSEPYVAETGVHKLGWRHFRRLVYFFFSGQSASLRETFDPTWRRGLWLYRGVPQIGDALMDLAPRSYLAELGLSMDLCTEPHLALLFSGDPFFDKVFTPETLGTVAYDFVIVQSHKSRSLRDKRRFFKKLPWVSVHGFFTGPEFHRAEFATRRLTDLTGHALAQDDFFRHARQKLKPLPAKPPSSPDLPARQLAVAFALGGVDPLRTYTRWVELATLLAGRVDVKITLLGSANAVAEARDFIERFPQPTLNLVNQTSLEECRIAMQKQDVVIACDGGLMHLAVTTETALVSLFHEGVTAAWRLPPDLIGTSLQSPTADVSAIEPGQIIDVVMKLRVVDAIGATAVPALPDDR